MVNEIASKTLQKKSLHLDFVHEKPSRVTEASVSFGQLMPRNMHS